MASEIGVLFFPGIISLATITICYVLINLKPKWIDDLATGSDKKELLSILAKLQTDIEMVKLNDPGSINLLKTQIDGDYEDLVRRAKSL